MTEIAPKGDIEKALIQYIIDSLPGEETGKIVINRANNICK